VRGGAEQHRETTMCVSTEYQGIEKVRFPSRPSICMNTFAKYSFVSYRSRSRGHFLARSAWLGLGKVAFPPPTVHAVRLGQCSHTLRRGTDAIDMTAHIRDSGL
jgi:hypothetical protein